MKSLRYCVTLSTASSSQGILSRLQTPVYVQYIYIHRDTRSFRQMGNNDANTYHHEI